MKNKKTIIYLIVSIILVVILIFVLISKLGGKPSDKSSNKEDKVEKINKLQTNEKIKFAFDDNNVFAIGGQQVYKIDFDEKTLTPTDTFFKLVLKKDNISYYLKKNDLYKNVDGESKLIYKDVNDIKIYENHLLLLSNNKSIVYSLADNNMRVLLENAKEIKIANLKHSYLVDNAKYYIHYSKSENLTTVYDGVTDKIIKKTNGYLLDCDYNSDKYIVTLDNLNVDQIIEYSIKEDIGMKFIAGEKNQKYLSTPKYTTDKRISFIVDDETMAYLKVIDQKTSKISRIKLDASTDYKGIDFDKKNNKLFINFENKFFYGTVDSLVFYKEKYNEVLVKDNYIILVNDNIINVIKGKEMIEIPLKGKPINTAYNNNYIYYIYKDGDNYLIEKSKINF